MGDTLHVFEDVFRILRLFMVLLSKRSGYVKFLVAQRSTSDRVHEIKKNYNINFMYDDDHRSTPIWRILDLVDFEVVRDHLAVLFSDDSLWVSLRVVLVCLGSWEAMAGTKNGPNSRCLHLATPR